MTGPDLQRELTVRRQEIPNCFSLLLTEMRISGPPSAGARCGGVLVLSHSVTRNLLEALNVALRDN